MIQINGTQTNHSKSNPYVQPTVFRLTIAVPVRLNTVLCIYISGCADLQIRYVFLICVAIIINIHINTF